METFSAVRNVAQRELQDSPAKTIGIGQLRSQMRDYLDRVAAGESFTILRRGRPVAIIHWAEEYGPLRPPSSIQSMGHANGIPVDLSQLRDRAGRYLDRVEDGERIDVTDRGNRVARIVAAPPSDAVVTQKGRCSLSLRRRL